jgi:hypothetical protein
VCAPERRFILLLLGCAAKCVDATSGEKRAGIGEKNASSSFSCWIISTEQCQKCVDSTLRDSGTFIASGGTPSMTIATSGERRKKIGWNQGPDNDYEGYRGAFR